VTCTNPLAAIGGIDAETVDSARLRASMQIRTRSRAVTATDFEFLACEATPWVARAVCIPPEPGGPIVVHLVPRVFPADRRLEADELQPSDELLTEVAEYLDERRLIGTVVHLRPCRFRGIAVVVNVQTHPRADPERVSADIVQSLYRYLNPLVGGPAGTGWPFGRPLNLGELYGIVHEVDGVEFVRVLRGYEADIHTGKMSQKPAPLHIALDPDELVASAHHIVKATAED